MNILAFDLYTIVNIALKDTNYVWNFGLHGFFDVLVLLLRIGRLVYSKVDIYHLWYTVNLILVDGPFVLLDLFNLFLSHIIWWMVVQLVKVETTIITSTYYYVFDPVRFRLIRFHCINAQ